MKTQYKYIYFQETIATGKTRKFDCKNNSSGDVLGKIAWYGAWRQYCFEPTGGTIFNSGCLTDIQDFIKQLMDARAQERGSE